MMSNRVASVLVGAIVAVGSALAQAQAQTPAQTWPTRPVTMVVPFAAGGPMDTVGAHSWRSGMGGPLGQQVVIENVGGGGGMIASSRVAKAPPDGYQFVLGNVGTHAVSQTLMKHPPYNARTDFAPVVLLADLSLVLVVRKDLPVDNLKTFIAYAKANQDKMQFASAGAGSATHLGCVLLNAAAGVTVTHVPYRGGALAMQDLVAGRVDYLCIDTPVAIPQIESGADQGHRRAFAEPFGEFAEFAVGAGTGACRISRRRTGRRSSCRRARPRPMVAKLNAAAVAAMNSPDVQKRLKENGVDIAAAERRSPDYLATFVAAEIDKWAGPVKAAGVVQE